MCEYCEVKMPEPFYDKTSRVEGRVRLWVDAREGLEPSIEFSNEADQILPHVRAQIGGKGAGMVLIDTDGIIEGSVCLIRKDGPCTRALTLLRTSTSATRSESRGANGRACLTAPTCCGQSSDWTTWRRGGSDEDRGLAQPAHAGQGLQGHGAREQPQRDNYNDDFGIWPVEPDGFCAWGEEREQCR